MVIVTANSKGGVGKTTLSTHLAAWLHEQGLRVAAVDADPQASLSQWLRQAAPSVSLFACTTTAEIYQRVPRLQHGFDVVVADGPAALTNEIGALLGVADVAIVPIMPSRLDIWASYRVARLIYRLQLQPGRRGRPKAITVLNRAQSRTRLARIAGEAIRQYGFPVSPVVIEARSAYAEACERGTTVWKLGRRAAVAAAEIARLFQFVLEQGPAHPAIARVLARCGNAGVKQRVVQQQSAAVDQVGRPAPTPATPLQVAPSPITGANANEAPRRATPSPRA